MMKRWSSLLLVTFLLLQTLCACQDMPSETTPDAGLSIDPMDSCAQSSGYHMAETDAGFYFSILNRLYYADKTDLTNWVLLCNDPQCDHIQGTCQAYLRYDTFYIKDQRLYTVHESSDIEGGVDDGMLLASRNLDGTDLRTAYKLEGSNLNGEGCTAVLLTPDCVYYEHYEIQKDGSCRAKLVRSDENGTRILKEISQEELTGQEYLYSAYQVYYMRGALCFLSSVADEDAGGWSHAVEEKLYRVGDAGLEEIAGLDLSRRFFSYWDGNTLYYSGKDGYTRLDPATGTTKKYLDKHFASAQGYCFDPTHIMETNYNMGVPGEDMVMAVYSQGKWQEINIPEEMRELDGGNLNPLAVTSDGMFFTVSQLGAGTYYLYYIPLDGHTNTPTFCKTFSVDGR